MVQIHPTAKVHPSARIACDHLVIGPRSAVGPNAIIEGRSIEIGAETWIEELCHIGGGSAYDEGAFLKAGDWLHMGMYSHINTARGVTVGHEFGCGIATRVFTHGAYPPAYEGFPVQWAPVTIGHRVWLPNAWVNPGVTIGDNVVVAANSLVNKSLPAGCLAGGVPAKVLKENAFPRVLSDDEKVGLLRGIAKDARVETGEITASVMIVGKTRFDVAGRVLEGPANPEAERVKNQLRRNGIRFRYYAHEGQYRPWD